MTDNYKEEQCANYGEEIAAREYERQREDGKEKQHMVVGEKVITGEWDGQPIWRKRTAGEVLANELEEVW